jgi:hypothetical protein
VRRSNEVTGISSLNCVNNIYYTIILWRTHIQTRQSEKESRVRENQSSHPLAGYARIRDWHRSPLGSAETDAHHQNPVHMHRTKTRNRCCHLWVCMRTKQLSMMMMNGDVVKEVTGRPGRQKVWETGIYQDQLVPASLPFSLPFPFPFSPKAKKKKKLGAKNLQCVRKPHGSSWEGRGMYVGRAR